MRKKASKKATNQAKADAEWRAELEAKAAARRAEALEKFRQAMDWVHEAYSATLFAEFVSGERRSTDEGVFAKAGLLARAALALQDAATDVPERSEGRDAA